MEQKSLIRLLSCCCLALVLLLGVTQAQAGMVPPGTPSSAIAPADPDYQTLFNNDPNINNTCDESVYFEQANAVTSANTRMIKQMGDNTGLQNSVDQARALNTAIIDLGFCQIKIQGLTLSMDALSGIASGIAAALVAAVKAALMNIINSVMASACNALIGAVNSALSAICIPNIALQFNLPSLQFPTLASGGGCNGTPLFSVTGGPSLATPPTNTGLPTSTYLGNIRVIE